MRFTRLLVTLCTLCISFSSNVFAACQTGNDSGFQWPVTDVPINSALDANGFIYRTSINDNGAITNIYKYHAGIDISGAVTDDIWPTASGQVVQLYQNHSTFGNTLIIDHKVINSYDPDGDGQGEHVYSQYSHLSSIAQSIIDEYNDIQTDKPCVTQGTPLGKMGSTGLSTGVHLHFETKTHDGLLKGYTPDYPIGYGYIDPSVLIYPFQETSAPIQKTLTVTTSSLNVRAGPGTQYRRITSLPNSHRVVAIHQHGSWYKIDLPHAVKPVTGWIAGWHTNESVVEGNTETIVEVTGAGSSGLDITGSTGSPVISVWDNTAGDCVTKAKVWDGQRFVSNGQLNNRHKIALPDNKYLFDDNCNYSNISNGHGSGYLLESALTIQSPSTANSQQIYDELVRWTSILVNSPNPTYLPATTAWQAVLRFLRQEYDDLFYAARDAHELASSNLLFGIRAHSNGNIDSATKYLESAKRWIIIQNELDVHAANIWINQLSISMDVARAFYDGSRASLLFGIGYVASPKASLAAEILFLPLDYTLDNMMYDESVAVQNLKQSIFEDVLVKVIIRTVPIPSLGGKTIDEWAAKGITYHIGSSRLYSLLEEASQNPALHAELVQALAVLTSILTTEDIERMSIKLLQWFNDSVQSNVSELAFPVPESVPQRSSANVLTSVNTITTNFRSPSQNLDISGVAVIDNTGSPLSISKLLTGTQLDITLLNPLQNSKTYTVTNLPDWDNSKYDWTFTTIAPSIQVGGNVIVSNTGGVGLNLRDTPTIAGTVLTIFPEDMVVTVVSGPVVSDGYTWWEVSDGVIQGWGATGDWLVPGDDGGLRVGAEVSVQNTGGIGLNIRDEPGTTASLLGTMSEGTQLSIVGGPIRKDGFIWWNVRNMTWQGWSAVAYWLYTGDDTKELNPVSAPVINQVTPSLLTGLTLPATQSITITGSGIRPDSLLSFNDGVSTYSDRIPTYISETELQYDIAVGVEAASWTVKVVNGVVESVAYPFSVVAGSGGASVTFSVSPSTTNAGDTAVLSWSSVNAVYCTASGGWSGTKSSSGSQIVTPTSSSTYIISCYGNGGTDTKSVSIDVGGSIVISIEANPDPVGDDEKIFYEMTVSNQGLTQLSNVVLDSLTPNTGRLVESADMTGGGNCVPSNFCLQGQQLQWLLGILDPGETKTVLMAVQAGYSPGATDGMIIHYPATVSYDDVSNGVSDTVSLARDVVVDNTPGLVLSLVESQDPVPPNGQVAYTLTYGNQGTVDVPNVVLSVPLPAGTNFVSATGGATPVGGEVQWMLGTVTAGSSGQKQFTVLVSAGAAEGSLMLAEGELSDGNTGQTLVQAQETTVVKTNIPLVFALTANPDPVGDDEKIFYEMTVSNQGLTQLSNVVLDSLTPNTGRLVESADMTGGGNCVPSNFCLQGQQLQWLLGILDPGETKTVLMAVQAGYSPGATDGMIIHYPATVSYDDVSNGVSDTVSLARDVVVDNNAPPVDLDVDGDGLTNSVEDLIGTNILLWDTDGDGLSDYTEVAYDGDPGSYVAGQDLNPFIVDTDGDGFSDYDEVTTYNSDPLDSNSIPIIADGDLNADGLVDVVDVILGQRILTGSLPLTPAYLGHGDVAPLLNGVPNSDGLFNLGDVLVIERKVLGVIDF